MSEDVSSTTPKQNDMEATSVSENGLFSDKYYKKILETQKPVYRHELAQVMYLANWLQQTIPGLAEIRDKFQKETSLEGKTLRRWRGKI